MNQLNTHVTLLLPFSESPCGFAAKLLTGRRAPIMFAHSAAQGAEEGIAAVIEQGGTLVLLVALAGGYCLGSIPFGLLITRFAGTSDIRSIGSGNIGATNVLRTGRKDLAAATLLLDGLKGTAAVLIATAWGGPAAGLAAAIGAFAGHIFPVWLGFRGGKGVATFLGCLLAVFWPVGLIFVVLWIAVAYVTKYSSASALVASVAAPIALAALGHTREAVVFLVMAAMLWFMHRANIGRLLDGSEGKIGKKA